MVPAHDKEANLPLLLADLESRPGLWERRAGTSKLRVIPTMRGSARLLARQLIERPERVA